MTLRANLPVSIALFTSFMLLSACGVPGLGGSSSSNSNERSDNVKSTIAINIEATTEMISGDDTVTWFDIEQQLFKLLTPAEAYAFRGLKEINSISTSAISVIALGPAITGSVSTEIPEHFVEELERGGYVIKFKDDLDPQINLVVQVKLPNKRVFYGPLYETGGTESFLGTPIDINIGTTYVIEKLFENIPSTEELNKHLPCANKLIDCQTQHQVKVQLLKSITNNAGLYEIEFESDQNFTSAYQTLENNTGFAKTVDTAIRELLRVESPIARGTRRTTFPLDATPWSREYHSSYFNLALNNYRPDNNNNDVVIAAATSDMVDAGNEELNNTFPIIPKLFTTTSVLEIRRDSALPLIPFTRTPLLNSSSNSYSRITNTPVKFFSAVSSDVTSDDQLSNNDGLSSIVFSRFLSTQGNLLLDRDIPQQIPVPEDNLEKFGWNYDPLYAKLYQANAFEPSFTSADIGEEFDFGSEPTWLTGAYYSGGKSFSLINASSGAFVADETQEELNLFSWEVHGLEAYEDIDELDILGRNYGVISYGVKLTNTTPFITIKAETLQWSSGNRQMTQTQPNTHYQSQTLQRNSADDVSETGPTSAAGSDVRSYFLIKTEEANLPSGVDQGLIGLDGGPRAPFGHTSDNGKHLAFTMNTLAEGRGLILATELRSSTPAFSTTATRYVLQGNTFEMDADSNVLRNLTGSELAISQGGISNCQATLSITYIKTRQAILDNSLTTTSSDTDVDNGLNSSLLQSNSSDCSSNGGEIEITFSNVLETGKDLTLKGFMTHASDEGSSPGNLINLLWIQPGSLGLVFAQRDQQLASSFEE